MVRNGPAALVRAHRCPSVPIRPSVPGAGFEPARPFGQWILSPPRLPFRHPGRWGRSLSSGLRWPGPTWIAVGRRGRFGTPVPLVGRAHRHRRPGTLTSAGRHSATDAGRYWRPSTVDGGPAVRGSGASSFPCARRSPRPRGCIGPTSVAMVRAGGGARWRPVEGWGECAALADTTYDREDVDGSFRALEDGLVPGLLALASRRAAAAGTVSNSVRSERPRPRPLAFAALEMAVADMPPPGRWNLAGRTARGRGSDRGGGCGGRAVRLGRRAGGRGRGGGRGRYRPAEDEDRTRLGHRARSGR